MTSLTDQPAARVRSPSRWRSRYPDLVFVLLLLTAWVAFVWPLVARDRLHGYDILRDAASAVNIQHGRVFGDPNYIDHTIWYPPLSPLLVAAGSGVSGVAPVDCYRWSQLLFNWLLPVGMFLVVRLQWGRRAAMGATVAMLLAMPWWQTEVAHGQPSIHAVVWGWAALLMLGRWQRRGTRGWALGCGAFLGLSFWHHPFVPAVLLAGLALQSVWAGWRQRDRADGAPGPARMLQQHALLIAVALLLAAPILYLMMHGPVRNAVPHSYLAPELKTVRFALMNANPWIWAMGLVGLVWAAQRAGFAERLLVASMVVCVLGQLPGYARLFDLPTAGVLPTVVPHEFQRLFQLGWAICVGIGIERTLCALEGRFTRLRSSAAATGGLTLAALLVTGVWGVPGVSANLREFLVKSEPWPDAERTLSWIERNTNLNDVFVCPPEWAFKYLCPRTGRKVWLTLDGHSNPRVDYERRRRILLRLRDTTSPEAFWAIARREGIDYCVPVPGWEPEILKQRALVRAAVPRYLRLMYAGPGRLPVLQVVPQPEGDEGTRVILPPG